jgi:hypothetical protein
MLDSLACLASRYRQLDAEGRRGAWPRDTHALGGYSYVPGPRTAVWDVLLHKVRLCPALSTNE